MHENGRSNSKQRYKCRNCKQSWIEGYTYKACSKDVNTWIVNLTKESCGIRSIARLLKISTNTVLKRLIQIAERIAQPIMKIGKEYEVDELCTFVKSKSNKLWVVLALQKDSKEVCCFAVGKRTLKTVGKVTSTLLLSNAGNIYTDKLPLYKSLIPEAIHKLSRYGTNHVERMNLNIRTHLKRFCRRSICFSRSIKMLTATLKIYLWNF